MVQNIALDSINVLPRSIGSRGGKDAPTSQLKARFLKYLHDLLDKGGKAIFIGHDQDAFAIFSGIAPHGIKGISSKGILITLKLLQEPASPPF